MQRKFNDSQVHELLYQALETERGGVKIYTTALKAAINKDLHKEWKGYLEETRTHESVLTNAFAELQTRYRDQDSRSCRRRAYRRFPCKGHRNGTAGRKSPRLHNWSPASAWYLLKRRTT